MGGWTERRKIGRASEVGLMEKMSAKSMATVQRKRRRRKNEPQKDAAREQKIRVEQTGPFLFGEGSLGPCTGGRARPCDP